MISVDEGALICDLAETYGVYDYRSLPVQTVATLSVGLRDNSRIKMKVRGEKASRDTVLLALIRDHLADLIYGLGMLESMPVHLYPLLAGENEINEEGFDTPEDFMAERSKFLGD